MSIASIVILCIFLALLIVPWIVELVYYLLLRGSSRRTEKFLCNHLRYLVYITGKVRSGKTTFQAGYANIRTKDLIKRALLKIKFICLAFPQIPFDCIEKRLVEDFEQGYIDSYTEAKKLLADGSLLAAYANLSYDNHLSAKPVPFLSLLADYIDARWALMRNNYVYYYGKAFHSWITNNDAMDYSPEMLNIKDCALNPDKKDSDKLQDYHLLPYSIICEDEKQLSGKDCTTFWQYSKQDSGAADCMRLIGQLGQETIYYTTTNQYWGTDINRERDLATEIVAMRKSIAINPHFTAMFYLNLITIPARINLWFKKKKKGYEAYLVNSKSRDFLGKIYNLKKCVASHSYVLFLGRIYHDTNDFGKTRITSDTVDALRAVIPIKYCRGSTNTFQFHSVQKMLIQKSRWKITDEPKAITEDDLASRVLKKRNQQGEKEIITKKSKK